MNYTIKLYKNNKIIEIQKIPIVIDNRCITLTCSNIDKIQLYDDIQRYIATYYYCFERDNKITFKKKPYGEKNDKYNVEGADMEFCMNCRYLSPKEHEQTKKKEKHICLKYNKRVRHLGFHPKLPRLHECDEPYVNTKQKNQVTNYENNELIIKELKPDV